MFNLCYARKVSLKLVGMVPFDSKIGSGYGVNTVEGKDEK